MDDDGDDSDLWHYTLEWIDKLEVAIDLLWGWMPAAQVKEILRDAPELAKLCFDLHEKLHHDP